jgi:hypothetical protein
VNLNIAFVFTALYIFLLVVLQKMVLELYKDDKYCTMYVQQSGAEQLLKNYQVPTLHIAQTATLELGWHNSEI